MDKNTKADQVPLVQIGDLKRAVRKIFLTTKKESDRQLAVFQASNARKRKAKKKR
jgi:hypothetical protein